MAVELSEIVHRLHGIAPAVLEQADRQARAQGTDLGAVLRSRQLLSEEQLLQAVAVQRGLPYLDAIDPRPGLARHLPPARALELRAVPVAMTKGVLLLATCERSHAGKEAALGRLLGQRVDLAFAPRALIERTFDALYTAGRSPGASAGAPQRRDPDEQQLALDLPGGASHGPDPGSTRVARLRDRSDSSEPRTQVDDALARRVRAELAGEVPQDDRADEEELDLFGAPSPAAAGSALRPESTLVLSLDDVVDDDELVEDVLDLIDVVEEQAGTSEEPQIGRQSAWYDTTGQTQLMRLPAALVPAEPEPDDAEGEAFGEYRLLRCIGMGGMAEVFEARRTMVAGLTRTVAVKRILPSYSQDEQFVTMFLDEAMITAQLNHPAIGQVLDVGKVGDDYYIAMEYLHGRNLEAVTKQARESDVPIPVAVAVHVVQQVLEGLDYAHRKRDERGQSLGIVHRDVSPANVICCYEGGVKIIDFGIARAAGKVSQTRAGLIKGKVCYMSPEQLREQPMDHRSDIFAAGVLLWELLAGRSLFGGKNDRETIVNIAHVRVPDLLPLRPQVPEAVARIVHQALQREPEARPAWAADMAEELRQAMGWHGDSEGRAQLAAFMNTHFT